MILFSVLTAHEKKKVTKKDRKISYFTKDRITSISKCTSIIQFILLFSLRERIKFVLAEVLKLFLYFKFLQMNG